MCYVCHYDSRGGTNNACMSVQNLDSADKVAGCAYCLVSHAVHGGYLALTTLTYTVYTMGAKRFF